MQPVRARRSVVAVATTSALIGVVLVLLAILLAGCSGGSKPAAARSSADPAGTATSPSAPSPSTSGSGGSTSTSTGASTGGAAGSATPPAQGAAVTRSAVPIAAPASFAPGITSTITAIASVTGTAQLPGEIAGPAVKLTVVVNNATGAPLDLANVTVDLQDKSGASATPLSQNGSAPFTGTLAAGGQATGIYVFTLATDDRTGVRVLVTASASLPVVVFAGDL